MHYGKSTFAKEVSQITILPKKDPRTELIPDIGQREQLSAGDIRQTSKMYRCSGTELCGICTYLNDIHLICVFACILRAVALWQSS